MPRHIAFLRAINVGGHMVKMDRLRALFESLEFGKVETFIASGNVIFDTSSKSPDALEKKIEKHLEKELGYEVITFLRSPAEVAAVVDHQPSFDSGPFAEGNSLVIFFLKEEPEEEARRKLMALRTEIDDFHIHRREVYWLCRTRISDSKISGGLLEKTLKLPATMRNVTTVRKLAAKYPPGK